MKKLILTIILFAVLKGVNAQYSKENARVLGDKAFNNKDYYEAAYYYKKSAEGLNLLVQEAVPYDDAGSKRTTKTKTGKTEDRAYICFRLGESYRLYENYLEAEGWYYKVLSENFEEKYPLSRLWYGVCLRANQHFDQAIVQLQKFTASNNGDKKYSVIAEKEILNCKFANEQYQYPLLIDVAKRKGSWSSDGSDYSLVQRDDNNYFTSSRFIKNDKKHLNRVYLLGIDSTILPKPVKFHGDDKINELEYGTPSFSPDGKRMYFTRWFKKGDKITHAIYSSEFKDDQWSTPQKLNNNINADGYNTIQPFITSDGKQMYFTSNKPGGQGGYDIWVSDLGSNGTPINSTNMGDLINTPLDEQGAHYEIENRKLVYSSKGFVGLGGFDFFETSFTDNKWTTPRNLGYPMNSAKDDLYFISDKKDIKKSYVSSDRESDCCLSLFEVIDRRHVLTGVVTDCNTHLPLAGAKVSFIDSISKEVIKTMVVGKDARYSFDVTTRRPYKLMLEKDEYFTKNVPVTNAGRMSNDTLDSAEICLQAFKVDKPIIIKNVLYDFNMATLRPESKLVLDELVTILKDNPKIKIELGSHTDSMGTDEYNNKLSQERAQACVDYIISSGIDEGRIYAKGYGERKPVAPNTLPDGKDDPDGRQLNRRTEFTVLKIE